MHASSSQSIELITIKMLKAEHVRHSVWSVGYFHLMFIMQKIKIKMKE